MADLPTLYAVPQDAGYYARELLRLAGPDLEHVCEELLVDPRPYDFDTTYEALLVPLLDGGFAALVSKRLIREDSVAARFCVAHECAHTLFYRRDGAPPTRSAPWSPSTGSPRADAEERFCDALAAELLVREDAPVNRLFTRKAGRCP